VLQKCRTVQLVIMMTAFLVVCFSRRSVVNMFASDVSASLVVLRISVRVQVFDHRFMRKQKLDVDHYEM